MSEPLQARDAWILLAILIKAEPGEYATLDQVIGAADYINHAIPTLGELDGALHRLAADGWIVQSELSFGPTDKAEQVYASRRGRQTSVHKDLDIVRNAIGAPEWMVATPLPPAPESCRVPGLDKSVVNAAYKAYKSRMTR